MLDYFERGAGDSATALMVWLHGLGADGYDLEPVAEMLGRPRVRHVFAHAPVRAVTINGGMAMRAWFDIAASDLRWREDAEGIMGSARQVRDLVRNLQASSGLPVVLAGFSQGAVISLAAAAQGVPGLAGIVAMSGYVPQCLQPMLANLSGIPVLMAHGEQDEVIPFALARAGCDLLVQNAQPVDWHAYPMPHTICQQEILDISNWLSGLLETA